MSFLAIDAQKSLFTLQRSQLAFEQTLVMNEAAFVTKAKAQRESELNEAEIECDDDYDYLCLQQEEEYLQSRQDALDSQINLLDNAINSMGNMVKNNIKSSCTLSLIGG